MNYRNVVLIIAAVVVALISAAGVVVTIHGPTTTCDVYDPSRLAPARAKAAPVFDPTQPYEDVPDDDVLDPSRLPAQFRRQLSGDYPGGDDVSDPAVAVLAAAGLRRLRALPTGRR